MVAMVMFLTPGERRRRLELAAERLGGKANLGRRLGYKDGTFVGQMIRAQRPISEKTIVALCSIKEISDLFAFSAMGGFKTAENDDVVSPQDPTPTTPSSNPAPELPAALGVVLDALAAAPQREKLRAALLALLEDDAPAYRARLAELLSAPALTVIKGDPDSLRLRIGQPKDQPGATEEAKGKS